MTRARDARLARLNEPGRIPHEERQARPLPPPSLPLLPKQPDSRSPEEFVISEGAAIRCLIRHYGWAWAEAGLLRRPK